VKVANNQNAWGGKGAKKSKKNPKFLVKTAGIEPALRKDFTTSNVIITEKKDRKAAAFQVKDLPYPYTSVEQFEARFKTPLGSEWNSRAVHQKETMPRVVKKVCFLSFLHLLSSSNIFLSSPLVFSVDMLLVRVEG
jgi:U3 small nucleolar RNA-associated protein 14